MEELKFSVELKDGEGNIEMQGEINPLSILLSEAMKNSDKCKKIIEKAMTYSN